VADLDGSAAERSRRQQNAMAQTSKSTSDGQNSSAQTSKTERTESNATARDVYLKEISQNPRFKEAPKSGKGFVIARAKG
jgi:hypothetical protein